MTVIADRSSGSDIVLSIGFGDVYGHERWSVWGNNPDVDTGTLPEVITPGGSLTIPPFWTVPTALEVVSDNAGDTSQVVIELLDSVYDRSFQTVTLNGLTPVQISGLFVAANMASMRALNIGNISVRDSGGGTTRLFMPAGRGVTQSAWRTVPAGYTLQVKRHLVSINRTATAGRWATYTGVYQLFSGGIYLSPIYALDVGVSDTVAFAFEAEPGLRITEKGRYWQVCLAVSANNTDISTASWGTLKKDGT